MKRKSILRRNLWETKAGKTFTVVCGLVLFYYLADRGILGLVEKRASYGGVRTWAHAYTGLNGQILGGAYLSFALVMLLGAGTIVIENEQYRKVAKRCGIIFGTAALLAWLTAILRELVQSF